MTGTALMPGGNGQDVTENLLGNIPRIDVNESESTRSPTISDASGDCGWVLCGLDTHDSVTRSLTNASEGILVSIDYRKGPEHPFPAAVEDCWAVAK